MNAFVFVCVCVCVRLPARNQPQWRAGDLEWQCRLGSWDRDPSVGEEKGQEGVNFSRMAHFEWYNSCLSCLKCSDLKPMIIMFR